MTVVLEPQSNPLAGPRRRQRREEIVRGVFLAAGISSMLISVGIVVSLLGESISFLRNIELTSLTESGWYPRQGKYDLSTLFLGSLMVTGIAMLIAAPLGLGAAIYLAEYARPRVRKVLKPILEILAGIPSIVLGFFAFRWIAPNVVQRLSEEATLFSLMSAGIGVGILVTPLVASVSEDALRAVPRTLREASFGIGARRVTTTLRVVFPAAISGIVASLILATSRAIGETMVVALAAGGSGGAQFTTNPFDEGQTITAAMASLASGTDAVAGGGGKGAGAAFQSLFFLGLLLFLITLTLNMIADRVVRRLREAY